MGPALAVGCKGAGDDDCVTLVAPGTCARAGSGAKTARKAVSDRTGAAFTKTLSRPARGSTEEALQGSGPGRGGLDVAFETSIVLRAVPSTNHANERSV